jgi:hypothetical protein
MKEVSESSRNKSISPLSIVNILYDELSSILLWNLSKSNKLDVPHAFYESPINK